MRLKKCLIKWLLLSALIAVTVFSCRKETTPEYDYFVSKELVFSASEASISAVIDYLENSFPGIAYIKQYLESGVNVYRIVYKTVVNGEEIEASGLVSIPDKGGEYPVMSFQHGTITLNSGAPSENPAGADNQLVEYMASMGFLMMLPDYPGFGESDMILHPYLIREPTVQSVIDMFRALKEICPSEFPGITIHDKYYLLGYSQGGWATLALHKAMELDFSDEFTLAGSACGAGPYNLYNLFLEILQLNEYPMPAYLGYIINAYASYDQFTNPVSEIINETYAPGLGTLYNGTMSLGAINAQLTTSIPGLFTQNFLSGYASSPAYLSVRQALINNSISAWNSSIPLFFGHGNADTDVSVTATELIYNEMIQAGTSPGTCTRIIYPDQDHGGAIFPWITDALVFLLNIRGNQK